MFFLQYFILALFPIRVDGSRGKEKNFFSREKAERRHRSFLLSPNPSPLFKKSGVFCKVKSSPLLEIIYPYGEQSLYFKEQHQRVTLAGLSTEVGNPR